MRVQPESSPKYTLHSSFKSKKERYVIDVDAPFSNKLVEQGANVFTGIQKTCVISDLKNPLNTMTNPTTHWKPFNHHIVHSNGKSHTYNLNTLHERQNFPT